MWRSIFTITMFLCFAVPSHAAWQSKADNKSVEELSLMTETELGWEAYFLCLRAVTMRQSQGDGSTRHAEATEYLTMIGRVTRKYNGGKDPGWMTEYKRAAASGSHEACNEVQTQQMVEVDRKKRR